MKAPDRIPPPQGAPRLEPAYVELGETLRRVRFWTEEEWEALEPALRPAEAARKPGVGWAAPTTGRAPS